MSPVPTRRELRARRRALRRELAAKRREARQRVQQLPEVQRGRQRRRVRRGLWAVLLLLLVLLARCECGPPPRPVPPATPTSDAGHPGLRPVPVVRADPTRLHADSTKLNRGKLSVPTPPPPTWLDELHLQVSARGPRMAQCFAGASGSGALRWTVSLDAVSGTVSAQAFEAVGTGADLSSTASDCLSRVLAHPAYHLTLAKDQPIPQRVSMVIEF